MSEQTRYIVEFSVQAIAGIRRLRDVAKQKKRESKAVSILNGMVQTLKSEPHNFGEPLRNARKAGGTVHCSFNKSLAVHFVIYEHEKSVFVYSFEVLGDLWEKW